jgi:multicomponent Na+:H+ antiporter subunit B
MTVEIVLSGLLVLCAGALVVIRPLMPSVLFLSAYSGLVVALLAQLGAVDVAFTEAVVGAGISTVLLMTLMGRIDVDAVHQPGRLARAFAVTASLGLGAALLPAVLALPRFGDPHAPASTYLAPDYVRRAVDDNRTPNVVTAILADYRGFDTLIETTVILTAAIACVLISRRRA